MTTTPELPALPEADDILHSLEGWSKAYPVSVFSEPTQAERDWLHATRPGLMDRIAASMGRHMAASIADDLALLKAALAAARGQEGEDAARYRWLIDYDGEDASPVAQAAWEAFCGPLRKEHIDAAIDAARGEESA